MSEQTSQPRDEQVAVVTFTTQWGSYYEGESAAFMPQDAEALVKAGVATEGGATPPEGGPVPEFYSVAGIDNPPRYWPPDPQHPDIVQTFDPSPLHQMQRTARDLEAGKPGVAAQEDLERRTKESIERAKAGRQQGAGPIPQEPDPPAPGPTPQPEHPPEPAAEGQSS